MSSVVGRVPASVMVIGIWAASEALVQSTGLPVSGGVLGLGVLLTLLTTGVLPLARVKPAEWLLRDMALFFIPALVAVVDHTELGGWVALRILAVVVLSMVIVMRLASWTVDHGSSRERS